MKEKELKLCLNIHKTSFIYEGEDKKLEKVSNFPFIDIEDQTNWKNYKIKDGNPNLIGQIHHIGNNKVVFHTCYNLGVSRFLDKEILKALIKGIEYIENEINKK